MITDALSANTPAWNIADIRARYGWTIRDFAAARRLGFPAATWRLTPRQHAEPVWLPESVEAWEAAVQGLRVHEVQV